MGPPSVFANLGGLAGAYSFEQNIAQPRCVASVKAESLPEYPGLVPTAWVQWVQAIVLDFADIEDRLIALRQTRHDRTLASRAVWCKHVSSSDPEKGGEHLDAQSRFWLDNQSATAKQKFPSSSAVAGLRAFHMRAALPLHSQTLSSETVGSLCPSQQHPLIGIRQPHTMRPHALRDRPDRHPDQPNDPGS